MLTIFGRKFARNDKEFVGSLFEHGGTCHGYYKRTVNGVRLFDIQRNPRAYVVCNPAQGYFAVTMHEHDGNLRYMHALCSDDKAWLGAPDSLMDEHAAIRAALAEQ